MATQLWGISKGEHTVTTGTGGATTDTVEITIDLANTITRAEALALVERITQVILKGPWLPA